MKKITTIEQFNKLKVGDQFLTISPITDKDTHTTLSFKNKTLKYCISDEN
jgi:hypothetical protein